ncbi:MAG TPA: hypothetical protein VK939_00435 [Longimicrobiales bacterium]|nr:hypothetical protein [Longimicrobiales bacterium]
MLSRRAGLLDWDRHSIRWAVLAIVCALLVGAMAQRSVARDMQAADAAARVEAPA